eukprot:2806027-Rhodomonas_salina.1
MVEWGTVTSSAEMSGLPVTVTVSQPSLKSSIRFKVPAQSDPGAAGAVTQSENSLGFCSDPTRACDPGGMSSQACKEEEIGTFPNEREGSRRCRAAFSNRKA